MKKIIQILTFLCVFNIYADVPYDTIYVQPITATKAYLGEFGTATLQIDDAGGDGFITKHNKPNK